MEIRGHSGNLTMLYNLPASVDVRLLRTRTALVGALQELLTTKSFDQITIREIAASAKVGYATYYRHYATKEALLHDLVCDQITKLIDVALPVVFVSSMRESCRTLCNFVAEQRALWKALLTGAASGILREEFMRQVRRLKGRYTGYAGWLPQDLHLACTTGATIDVLNWWLSQNPMVPVDDVLDLLDSLICTLSVTRGQPNWQSA